MSVCSNTSVSMIALYPYLGGALRSRVPLRLSEDSSCELVVAYVAVEDVVLGVLWAVSEMWLNGWCILLGQLRRDANLLRFRYFCMSLIASVFAHSCLVSFRVYDCGLVLVPWSL